MWALPCLSGKRYPAGLQEGGTLRHQQEDEDEVEEDNEAQQHHRLPLHLMRSSPATAPFIAGRPDMAMAAEASFHRRHPQQSPELTTASVSPYLVPQPSPWRWRAAGTGRD